MHEVRENPTTDRGSSPDWDYAEFVLGGAVLGVRGALLLGDRRRRRACAVGVWVR